MDCTEQPSVPEKKQNYRSLKYFISEMIKSNLAILRSESVWHFKFFCNQEVCVLLNAVDHAKDHFTQTEKQLWH